MSVRVCARAFDVAARTHRATTVAQTPCNLHEVSEVNVGGPATV